MEAAVTQTHSAYQSRAEWITQPERIAGQLDRLQRAHTLLTVTVGGSSDPYNSILLDIDRSGPHLLMDQLHPPAGHEQLLVQRRFRVHARHEGIELSFEGRLTEVITSNGQAIYRVRLPEKLYYRQRRAHYRAQVGRGNTIPVYLLDESESQYSGWLANISVGGIGAHLDAKTLEELDQGVLIPTCRFETPDRIEIASGLEIRFVQSEAQGKWLRIGGRFTRLDRQQERAIQRFVAQLDRELIKKKPRD